MSEDNKKDEEYECVDTNCNECEHSEYCDDYESDNNEGYYSFGDLTCVCGECYFCHEDINYEMCVCGNCKVCTTRRDNLVKLYSTMSDIEKDKHYLKMTNKFHDRENDFEYNDCPDIVEFYKEEHILAKTITGRGERGNMKNTLGELLSYSVSRELSNITEGIKLRLENKYDLERAILNRMEGQNNIPGVVTVNGIQNIYMTGNFYKFLERAKINNRVINKYGDLIVNKPFLFKLDKETKCYGIIKRGINSGQLNMVLYIKSKNKEKRIYHWLKLRRILSYNNSRNYGTNLPKDWKNNQTNRMNTYSPGFSLNNFNGMAGEKGHNWNRFVSPHKESISNYIKAWSSSQELYSRLGKSYKTGILLYGPTGTGKSTAIKAIEEITGYNPIRIDFSQNLRDQFEKIGKGSIVIMEELETKIGKRVEIDANNNSKTYKESNKKLELTGEILQLMDGDIIYNEVIFIATTNDISKLDKSVVRAGRFDKTYNMNNFNEEQAKELCKNHDLNYESISDGIKYPICPAELERIIHNKLMEKEMRKLQLREIMLNLN